MPYLIKHKFNCSFEANYPGPLYTRTVLTKKSPKQWFNEFKKILGVNNPKILKTKEISQDKFLQLRHLKQFWNRENFDRYNEITRKYE